MSALFIVLPLALLVVLAGVGAYLWAARRGQFDDLTTPAIRMLHDDERRGATAGPPPAPGTAEPPRPDGEAPTAEDSRDPTTDSIPPGTAAAPAAPDSVAPAVRLR